jgi:hypothetical protein
MDNCETTSKLGDCRTCMAEGGHGYYIHCAALKTHWSSNAAQLDTDDESRPVETASVCNMYVAVPYAVACIYTHTHESTTAVKCATPIMQQMVRLSHGEEFLRCFPLAASTAARGPRCWCCGTVFGTEASPLPGREEAWHI